MSHVSTTDLIDELDEGDKHYAEVLSSDAVSVELAQYPNPAPQHPHKEDELYYIISGSGTMTVGDETHEVGEGDVVYVEQGVEHDFVDVDAQITALVVFAGGQDSVFERNG